jgi:hypothetical protein
LTKGERERHNSLPIDKGRERERHNSLPIDKGRERDTTHYRLTKGEREREREREFYLKTPTIHWYSRDYLFFIIIIWGTK